MLLQLSRNFHCAAASYQAKLRTQALPLNAIDPTTALSSLEAAVRHPWPTTPEYDT